MSFIAILAASFAPFTLGSTVRFNPNCTLPPEGTNYVSGPNVRGTVSILWNCLSIILICSWNILHLNIPASRPHPKGFFQTIWQAILDSRTKVKWMLFTILVPEFLVGKAFNSWWAARALTRRWNTTRKLEEWTMVHSYYSNMGGFVVDFSVAPPPDGELTGFPVTAMLSARKISTSSDPKPTTGGSVSTEAVPELEIMSSAAAGGLRQKAEKKELTTMEGLVNQVLEEYSVPSIQKINLSRMRHNLWAPNCFQLWQLVEVTEDPILTLPNVPAADLERLSKGDALVKLLAVIQVLWLVVQLIARKVKGLPSSQLEIATLAFSAASLVTYMLFWKHPQGVQTVVKMPARRLLTRAELLGISMLGPRYLWTGRRMRDKIHGDMDLVPIPNDAIHFIGTKSGYLGGNDETMSLLVGAILGGTLFGGLHCLAWNFHFPTQAEAILWRTCSVLMAALPTLSLPLTTLWLMQNNRFLENPIVVENPMSFWNATPTWARSITAGTLIIFFATPYFIARLIIMIEIFRDLCFSKPDVFVETWSGAFPHWG